MMSGPLNDARRLLALRHDPQQFLRFLRQAWPAWVFLVAAVGAGFYLGPALVATAADWLAPPLVEKRFFGLVTRMSDNPWRPRAEMALWAGYGLTVVSLTVWLLRRALAGFPDAAAATMIERRKARPAPAVADTEPAARYVIGRELGRGAMGVVHEANDVLLHRTVALKTLAPHLTGNPDLRARFLREARAVARLSHPGIVGVYDLVVGQGECRIAMEYVHGPSLAELAGGEAQPVDRVLAWGEALADALAYAHEQGVIHRDIKPANVLMARAEEPRLTDFGLAKIAGQASETQFGTVMGSPSYMSPEQANGELVDHRTDVYALGILLYELLVGQPPFTGDSGSVIAGHLARAVPPISAARPDAPAGLVALIGEMLAKKPLERPASMRGVQVALAELRRNA